MPQPYAVAIRGDTTIVVGERLSLRAVSVVTFLVADGGDLPIRAPTWQLSSSPPRARLLVQRPQAEDSTWGYAEFVAKDTGLAVIGMSWRTFTTTHTVRIRARGDSVGTSRGLTWR